VSTWKKGQLTCKRIGVGSLAETLGLETAGKIGCSFDIIGVVPFADSWIQLRLGSGPPNKIVSRELPGEVMRPDMQLESIQRSLPRLKQIIVSQS
jgi:hypothetical protein